MPNKKNAASRESLAHLRAKLCEIDSELRLDAIAAMQHHPGCRHNVLPHHAMEAALCNRMQSQSITLDSPMYMHYAALRKMAQWNCALSEEVLSAVLSDAMSAIGHGQYHSPPGNAHAHISRAFACSEDAGRLREFCTHLGREQRCRA